MNNSKLYRNEWKYILPQASLCAIESRLKAILPVDENSDESGIYEIHSLYFDDLYNTSARENDAGISERYKYRIRYYGKDKDFIKLERKEKKNGMCHKDSCRLSLDEYERILSGQCADLIYETDKRLLKEFVAEILTKGYAPKAIVDYERVAFVEPITNVRITIDRNISSADNFDEFLTGDYIRYPLQDKHQHVLEVKFDAILPGYIRNVISDKNLVQTSFSKYYLGRKVLKSMGRY